jgi:hypothetical protein
MPAVLAMIFVDGHSLPKFYSPRLMLERAPRRLLAQPRERCGWLHFDRSASRKLVLSP